MRGLIKILFTLFIATALSVQGFAGFAPQKIKFLLPQLADSLMYAELDEKSIPMGSLDDLQVCTGSELRIYLLGAEETPSLFYDQNNEPMAVSDVTLSKLQAARIQMEIAGDSAVLDSIGFAYSRKNATIPVAAPYIKVRFGKSIVGTEGTPFRLGVRLCMDGTPVEGTEIILSGEVVAQEQTIEPDLENIAIQEGKVIVVAEDISGAEVDVGNGVTIITDLKQGERYSGSVRIEEGSGNANPTTLASGSPYIERRYELTVANLDTLNAIVTIDSEVTLYVYDSAGNYLGTTRQELPYSNQYTVTNRRLA